MKEYFMWTDKNLSLIKIVGDNLYRNHKRYAKKYKSRIISDTKDQISSSAT